MSADSDAPAPHEVVIVRRRGGDGEDGHHGGAWKIAFADLMTAMMAFFLVMWLLNVSDKEKIQQIATYFNPLKLNSKRPTTKGVEDEQETSKSAPLSVGPADKGVDKSTVDDKKTMQGASKPGGDGELAEGVAQKAEEELFNDPYGVLARLALKADKGAPQAGAAKPDSVLPGGDAFTNPFEPFADQSITSNKTESPTDRPPPTLDIPGIQPKPLEPAPESTAESGAQSGVGSAAQPAAGPAAAAGPNSTAGSLAETKQAAPTLPPTPPASTSPVSTLPASTPPDATPPAPDGPSAKGLEDVRELKAEILKQLQGLAPEKKPAIDVQWVDEGLLISLTDDFRFGMFASASAEPRPETVVVMEKLAKVLVERDGQIVVRGHTDARPFKSEKNNNWRLSSARAQMAYYMLVRGGVTESRFESIEGHADRNLKLPTDPNAAENRRIEILLRMPKT